MVQPCSAMKINVDDALEYLRCTPAPPPRCTWPEGAPAIDFERSPVAASIGRHAAAEELFCFHYEYSKRLETPESWLPSATHRNEPEPDWAAGRLPEAKYLSFRHDLMIGSFHPGHRGKWTTHEMCHALVGFAWRPDASALFHATAARLAELLPVAVYYFFDELRLQRCPVHQTSGALYRTFCRHCEDCAGIRPIDPDQDRYRIEEGLRYIKAELAAIAQTQRQGTPIPYCHATLNLMSDGLAYARNHQLRLDSAAFHDFVDLFGGPGSGRLDTLDALQERIVDLTQTLLLGDPYPARHRAHRDRWVSQDLGMRLLQIREQTEGEAERDLNELVEKLAAKNDPETTMQSYRALHEEFVLPAPEDVFAVGYALGEQRGRSVAQIERGLQSITPLTLSLFETVKASVASDFANQDPPSRRPLGQRFSDWLAENHDPEVAALSRFEWAIQDARYDEQLAGLGPSEGPVNVAEGFIVIRSQHDLVALAESIDQGARPAMVDQGRVRLTLDEDAPGGLIVGRDAAGELLLVGIDEQTAKAIEEQDMSALTPSTRSALLELGALAPSTWSFNA